jgi:hypothetical protein
MEDAVESPYATRAALVTCMLIAVSSSTSRGQVCASSAGLTSPRPTPREPAPRVAVQDIGCGIQYDEGKELTQVTEARIRAVFRNLLARFGIAEPVLLCSDIPLREKNFAETIRRSDGRAIVAISTFLLEFNDGELTGMLAHELAHLVAGDPERPRPASFDEYLREECETDIMAAELVGVNAMRAAVLRAYRMSVALGFESKTNVLRRHRDRRLTWIMKGERERCQTAAPARRGLVLLREGRTSSYLLFSSPALALRCRGPRSTARRSDESGDMLLQGLVCAEGRMYIMWPPT